MTSIRTFLIATILATITLVNFGAALHGYRESMVEASRLLDNQLLDVAKLIVGIDLSGDTYGTDFTSSFAFQVWRDGALIRASSNAPTTAMNSPQPGFGYTNFAGHRWRTVTHFDTDQGTWVMAAQRANLRYTLAENVILESILPIVLVLPILGLLIWIIVSRGLRPLSKLALQLQHKQSRDLSPLKITAPRRELDQVVRSINHLLTRLDSSLARERRFASDAAHELRTPISALKVELYNLHQDNPGLDSTLANLELSAKRLEHLVEQILLLYRTAPDQHGAQFVCLDLHSLAQEVIAAYYPHIEAKNQDISLTGYRCNVLGDRFALETLVHNLLSNANKYTPPGGSIAVSLIVQAEELVLTVEDSGGGIAPDEHERIFERFYRGGGDRHPSGEPGCGLGLSIVKHIVLMHGATITVAPSPNLPGACFSVSFPLHKGPAS